LERGGDVATQCFRDEHYLFLPAHADVAGDVALEALGSFLSHDGIPLSKLDGLLFVVGSRGVRALSDGRLVPAAKGLSDAGEGHGVDRRSTGGILLIVGDAMGGTLKAAGEPVSYSFPRSPSDFFGTWFPGEKDRTTYLRIIEEELERQGRTHNAPFNVLVQACLEPSPSWLSESTDASAVWLSLATALVAELGSTFRVTADWLDVRSQAALRRKLQNAEDSGTRGARSLSSDERFDTWLRERVQEVQAHAPSVGLIELGEDSGLKAIYQDSQNWRRLFARERFLACVESRKQIGRRDFGEVAPVPELGSRRPSESPGLPIQDALWTIRALQECFPGRLAAGETAPLRIRRVSLCLPGDRPGPDRPSVPEAFSNHTVVFDDKPVNFDLRAFGSRVVEHVKNLDRYAKTDTHYMVCVTVDTPAAEAEQETLVARFPWRFKERPWTDREQCLAKDAQLFTAVRHELEELGVGAFRRGDLLLQRLSDLQETWDAWPETDKREKGEAVGLLVNGGCWDIADNFLRRWEETVAAFLSLFETIGDLAHRVAFGPLHRFLEFGMASLSFSKRYGEEAVRVFGYHPLRLKRLVHLERRALKELLTSIQNPGTLRDVPLSNVPWPTDSPAVFWRAGPNGEDKYMVPGRADQPFDQVYVPFTDPSHRESDLIESARPILYGLSRCLFSGMQKRQFIRLHGLSDTYRGFQPLVLLADAVNRRDSDSRRLTEGVELVLDEELSDVPRSARELERFGEEEELSGVSQAMSQQREDDPRFGLEVRLDSSTHSLSPVDNGDALAHLCLFVRPWERKTHWVVRKCPEESESTGTAMLWNPQMRAWSATTISGEFPEEHGFHNLVIRRKRGEPDNMKRALGLALDAGVDHRFGKEMHDAIEAAAARCLRVLIMDRVFGPEAIDARRCSPDTDGGGGSHCPLRVTYADYHRKSGWRLTLLAHEQHDPERELKAARRGLERLFPGLENSLSERVYQSTHRALPSVTRELWRLGVVRNLTDSKQGEPIGHLGVALFVSSFRSRIRLRNLSTSLRHSSA